MKKLALLFCLFAFHGPLEAQEERSFQLPLFTEGLSTRYSANAIPDGALTEALNVTLDEDIPGVPVTRNGRQKYNSTAIQDSKSVRGLWPFDASDGTKYFVSFSSGSFFKTSGDGTWTQINSSTFSTTVDFDCTQALGYLWCINGEAVFRWDGTSTSTVSAMPLGTLVEHFRNRIVEAGISGSKSRIRLSGELDGTDWTTGAMSTSPANIAVGGVDDGQDVTCLMGVYQDVLIIGKRDSLWGLYGFGTTDFSLRELSREVGCIDDRTVREKNNCLYWMSKRGIEKFCGARIERISDPIRDQLDQIITTIGNPRSSVDSSQSDFNQGNITASGAGAPMSTTINPGNVVPSSWTAIDTSSSDFSAGTYSNIDYISVDGSIILSSTVFQDNFSDGNYTSGQATWTVGAGTFVVGDGIQSQKWITATTEGSYIYNNKLNSSQITTSSGSWEFDYYFANDRPGGYEYCGRRDSGVPQCLRFRFIKKSDELDNIWIDFGTVSPYTGQERYIALMRGNDGTEVIISSKISSSHFRNTVTHFEIVISSWPGSEIKVFRDGSLELTGSYSGLANSSGIEISLARPSGESSLISNSVSNIYHYHYDPSGYLISRHFDTQLSTPIFGAFSSIFTSINNETSVLFHTQSASSTYGVWSDISRATDTIKIGSNSNRWIRYRGDLYTYISTKTPTVNAVSMLATTTGYFISQCRNPSTNITKWGNFQCNTVNNGGSFSYWISTGTSCNEVTRTTANWQSQTNNTAISFDTSPYVAYRTLFSLDSATQAPTLQDCTINWIEGETRPPTASSVYRDRYYLAYTSSTASGAGNDHILVLDKNDKWTLFDHHDCYSLGIYERKLYCGSSLADGFVWKMDYGTDDGGTGFTSRIRTKAFNLGEPEKRKTYSKAYFEFSPEGDSAISTDITARYVLDRGTTTFSLGTLDLNDDPSHIPLADFPFPIESPVSSRYLQLEIESSGLNQPWRMFGGKVYYQTLRKE